MERKQPTPYDRASRENLSSHQRKQEKQEMSALELLLSLDEELVQPPTSEDIKRAGEDREIWHLAIDTLLNTRTQYRTFRRLLRESTDFSLPEFEDIGKMSEAEFISTLQALTQDLETRKVFGGEPKGNIIVYKLFFFAKSSVQHRVLLKEYPQIEDDLLYRNTLKQE